LYCLAISVDREFDVDLLGYRRSPGHLHTTTFSAAGNFLETSRAGAVLRIHFTVADLARLRVAVLGPFAELQLSFAKLLAPERRPVIDSWRARTIARGLPPDVREAAAVLVAPPLIHPVDLFTLVGPAVDYAEAVDRLCGVPPELLRHEFESSVAVTGTGPGWVGDFATADRSARHRLTRALDSYHEVAIAPYWSRIRELLENERAGLVDVMSAHGLEAMLAELAPALQWRAQVLEIPSFRGRLEDYYLNGRGMVLPATQRPNSLSDWVSRRAGPANTRPCYGKPGLSPAAAIATPCDTPSPHWAPPCSMRPDARDVN
jgi:hypothetical protein